MKCDKFQACLPDMLLDPARVADGAAAEVQQHLTECSRCENDWNELQATMRLLDDWTVPEPSPYFDTRMSARLREEKNAGSSSWLERMRTGMLAASRVRLRPALAGAFALLLIAGAGSYEGFVHHSRTPAHGQTVSATVNDLELLDRNAQTLQQLAAFDNTDAPGQSSSDGDSN